MIDWSEQLEGDAVVLSVTGELDLTNADRFRDEVAALVTRTACHELVVDLREVVFIDSSGLRSLIRIQRGIENTGRLVLRSPSRTVQRVLDIATPGVFEIEV